MFSSKKAIIKNLEKTGYLQEAGFMIL